MTIFDKQYYEDIWKEGVHRHDYVENWISRFKNEFKDCKSILDIGTGCGFMVKRLREEGYDAWGLEISDYAIENSCAKGYVIKGDVRDIPFKDNRFDLVFSQGLWTYIPENEVDQATKEVHRVGKKQLHNIDHDKCLFLPHFITWKPIEWWNKKLQAPKVLVACPTHISKDYCFQKWIDVVKKLTYLNYEIFVVDNSSNGEMVTKYSSQIPIIHLKVDSEDKMIRINNSMEVIRQKFLNGDYTYWFNLECDVIPTPDILDILMKFTPLADWIGHAYPLKEKGNDLQVSSGIGCTLLNKEVVKDYSFQGIDESPDAAFWTIAQQKKVKTIEIYHYCVIKHLKE